MKDEFVIDDKFVIEDALKELADITAEMEKPETTLQESLKLYAKGVQLANACKENLEGVEKEIQILNEI